MKPLARRHILLTRAHAGACLDVGARREAALARRWGWLPMLGVVVACAAEEAPPPAPQTTPRVVSTPETAPLIAAPAPARNPMAALWTCLQRREVGDAASALGCVPEGCAMVLTASTESDQPACTDRCALPRIVFTCEGEAKLLPSFTLCPRAAASDRIEVAMEVFGSVERGVGEGSAATSAPVIGVELANFETAGVDWRRASLGGAIHTLTPGGAALGCESCHDYHDIEPPTPNGGIFSMPRPVEEPMAPDAAAAAPILRDACACLEREGPWYAREYAQDPAVVQRAIELCRALVARAER